MIVVEARTTKLLPLNRLRREPPGAPLYPRRVWRVHGWRRARREVVARELELRPLAEIDPHEALEEIDQRE